MGVEENGSHQEIRHDGVTLHALVFFSGVKEAAENVQLIRRQITLHVGRQHLGSKKGVVIDIESLFMNALSEARTFPGKTFLAAGADGA